MQPQVLWCFESENYIFLWKLFHSYHAITLVLCVGLGCTSFEVQHMLD